METSLPNPEQLLKIQTSKGRVYFRARALYYDWHSQDRTTHIVFTEGKEILDEMYVYDTHDLKLQWSKDTESWWLKVGLSDGHYGSPEYSVTLVEETTDGKSEPTSKKCPVCGTLDDCDEGCLYLIPSASESPPLGRRKLPSHPRANTPEKEK